MKNLLVLTVLLLSNFAHAEIKDFDHYMDKSCEEMTNQNSSDEFIQFTSKEILSDLSSDFCSKVVDYEISEDLESSNSKDKVSQAQYGKLIDSLYQYYESIN